MKCWSQDHLRMNYNKILCTTPSPVLTLLLSSYQFCWGEAVSNLGASILLSGTLCGVGNLCNQLSKSCSLSEPQTYRWTSLSSCRVKIITWMSIHSFYYYPHILTGSRYVDQTDCSYRDPPGSAFPVLQLRTCAILPYIIVQKNLYLGQNCS